MLAYFVIAADDGFFRSGYLTSEGKLDGSFGIMVILQSVMIAVFSLYCIEYKNNSKGDSIIKLEFRRQIYNSSAIRFEGKLDPIIDRNRCFIKYVRHCTLTGAVRDLVYFS